MKNFSLKNINEGASSDENEVQVLLSELEKLLPVFPKSTIFEQVTEDSDEDHYTELLIKFLSFKASKRFVFFNQASQKKDKRKARTVDISIYLSNDELCNYIFCIEAKYLPTSNYVTGDSAAIKRFKKCEHGLSNTHPKLGKPLPENAIVAYVTAKTFAEHKTSINKKITQLSKKGKDKFGLIWKESEHLKNTSLDYKYISSHPRQNTPNIKLHHFWVNVNTKK
ncbi:MAG: hypothetical protein AB8G11_15625 [Saprospiraceae bacterium]